MPGHDTTGAGLAKRLAARLAVVALFAALLLSSCAEPNYPPGGPFDTPPGSIALSFSVASDMRYYSGTDRRYFRSAAERIAEGGAGSFMISAGDIDPPDVVYDTILRYIGAGYGWFPVVGNHEAETPSDMAYLRSFTPGGSFSPDAFNPGPTGSEETTYSFDTGGIHFVVLNQYYDGTSDVAPDGDIGDDLYAWLDADLAAQSQSTILVFGHEPAYVRPDAETGRVSHDGDSLDKYPANRDRFWTTLETYGVTAFICGHTHNYSVAKSGTVWQIDSGHSRGLGDTGAPSTFLMLYAMDTGELWLYTYRLDPVDGYLYYERLQLK